MNILVTGANGFIGRRLTLRLNRLGHQVFSFPFDITKPFHLNRTFDLTIHLAAYNITHIGDQSHDLYTAINAEGTANLLSRLRTQRFVYLSTTKVYKNDGRELHESSPLGPQGAYEQSKLQAEELCRAQVKPESLVILRSVNVLGWGQAFKAVLPVFFQKARANKTLEIIGSAQNLMSFIYVEDLVDAFVDVIKHPQTKGIFNIAHPEPVSLEELAKMTIEITRSSSTIKACGRVTNNLFSPVNCQRAYEQLAWGPKTDLREILKLYAQEERY